jgi:hypothetical protein
VQLANKKEANKGQISCSLKPDELQCSNGAKWIVDSTSSASGSTDELISPSSPCLWPQVKFTNIFYIIKNTKLNYYFKTFSFFSSSMELYVSAIIIIIIMNPIFVSF